MTTSLNFTGTRHSRQPLFQVLAVCSVALATLAGLAHPGFAQGCAGVKKVGLDETKNPDGTYVAMTGVSSDGADTQEVVSFSIGTDAVKPFLVVMVAVRYNPNTSTLPSATSITWQATGESAEALTENTQAAFVAYNNDHRTQIWGLSPQHVGSGTITVNLSSSARFNVAALWASNVDPNRPWYDQTNGGPQTPVDSAGKAVQLADSPYPYLCPQSLAVAIFATNGDLTASAQGTDQVDFFNGVTSASPDTDDSRAVASYGYDDDFGIPYFSMQQFTWQLGGGATDLVGYSLASLNPASVTAADLIDFSADYYANRGTLLRWHTGQENETLGFKVWRQDSRGSTLVTPEILGSALLGTRQALQAGNSYAWFDPSGRADSEYFLDDVQVAGGSRRHGPFYARAGNGPIPLFKESGALGAGTLSSVARRQASAPWPTVPLLSGSSTHTLRRILPRSPSKALQWQLAGEAAVKIGIDSPGWYRVTPAQLAAAGIDLATTDPARLQLFVDGVEQPMVHRPWNGSWALEFFATPVDEQWTGTRVYWLAEREQPGLRVETVDTRPEAGAAAQLATFNTNAQRQDHLVYFASSLPNGPRDNFFGAPISASPVDELVHLASVNQSSALPARVTLAVQGVTNGAHQIDVALNGRHLGRVSLKDQEWKRFDFPVTASMLLSGDNSVTASRVPDGTDVSLVDFVRIDYPRFTTVESDQIVADIDPATVSDSLQIGGFLSGSVRVVDVTDPASVSEWLGTVTAVPGTGTYALSLKVPSSVHSVRRLYAFTETQVHRPAWIRANIPSHWNASGQGADMLVLTNQAIAAGLEPLVAHRRAEGLKVAVVDVEDLYDEFTFGTKSPEAIRSFLARVKSAWQPVPRFVLLAGDASYDPRNYLGSGSPDLVPTWLAETSEFRPSGFRRGSAACPD